MEGGFAWEGSPKKGRGCCFGDCRRSVKNDPAVGGFFFKKNKRGPSPRKIVFFCRPSVVDGVALGVGLFWAQARVLGVPVFWRGVCRLG